MNKIQELYGYFETLSTAIGPDHIMDYMQYVGLRYSNEIVEDLKSMGLEDLAEDYKKAAPYCAAYILIVRELKDKLLLDDEYKKFVKILFKNDVQLSGKTIERVSYAIAGKPIMDMHNPFGMNGVSVPLLLSMITNPRGAYPYKPFFNLEGITDKDMGKIKEEIEQYLMELKKQGVGVDKENLARLLQPQPTEFMPRVDLDYLMRA